MADSTLSYTQVSFIDTWPDYPPGPIEKPSYDASGNILTNSSHHNVANPKYEVGQKVVIVDPSHGKPCKFMYVQIGTQDTTAIAAGALLGEEIAEGLFTGKLTNKHSTIIDGGRGAMALSAMTDNYYGWVQIEGPPAYGLVPALVSTTLLKTDGTIDAQDQLIISNTSDSATDTYFSVAVAESIVIGIASAADA